MKHLQKNKRSLTAILGAVAAAALMLMTPAFEGRELTTYKDLGGVLTYCDGATLNAEWGKTYTPAECDAQLEIDLARHAEGVMACTKVPLTDGQKIAFVDFAYNLGVANYCGSSAARLTNAGKAREGCLALAPWNGVMLPLLDKNGRKQYDANGKVIKYKKVYRGLERRRQAEIKVCLRDLP